MLYGFDRDRQQIVHQADFLLQEWLAICHATERAIETCHRLHAVSDGLMSREDFFTRFLIAELRFVGKNRRNLSFELITDIHDECRPNIVIKRGVDDFEWTVRRKGTARPWLRVKRQLCQPRQEASLVTEKRSGVMVRMPSLPIRKNHDARTRLPDDRRDFQTALPGVFHPAVRYIKCVPPLHSNDRSRITGFTLAVLG